MNAFHFWGDDGKALDTSPSLGMPFLSPRIYADGSKMLSGLGSFCRSLGTLDCKLVQCPQHKKDVDMVVKMLSSGTVLSRCMNASTYLQAVVYKVSQN